MHRGRDGRVLPARGGAGAAAAPQPGQLAARRHTVGLACRPQAPALVAALADPDRGWDAIVIHECDRAVAFT